MGSSRKEYWNGLPLSSPVDLPDPGIKPGSPALQADFLPTELPQRWFWEMEYIGVFSLSISFCILNCYNENVLFL